MPSPQVQQLAETLAELRARAFTDPAWFYAEVLGQTGKNRVKPWQLRGIQAVLDVERKALGLPTVVNHEGKPRVTIRSCHGTGKTHFLALLLHLWNFLHYGLVAATAPKQEQLKTRLWPRYRAVRRCAVDWYQGLTQAQALKIEVAGDTDWGVVAETASDPENLAGYHETPQLFVVDEASAKRLDPMYQTIEGALTTPGSVVVEIGNPTRGQGEFYDHHNKPNTAPLYFRMHVRQEDAPDLVSQEWMDAMAAKYGKDSPVYKVRCLGEFVEADANQLIPYGWLVEAAETEFEEDGSVPRLVVSVDVMAGGDDFTVCEATRFYQTRTHKLRQEKHSFDARVSSKNTALAAAEMFDRFGGSKEGEHGDVIYIDMMGPGNGAYNYLIEWGYPVAGYAGGSSSDNKQIWRNRRVQCYWAFHDELMTGRVAYAENFVDTQDDWDEYCSQVCSIYSRPGDERVEDLEPKEMLVRRTGKSPDRADCSAISYHTELPHSASQVDHTAAAFGSTFAESYDADL